MASRDHLRQVRACMPVRWGYLSASIKACRIARAWANTESPAGESGRPKALPGSCRGHSRGVLRSSPHRRRNAQYPDLREALKSCSSPMRR